MEYDVLDITDKRARELAQILANDKAVAILKVLQERELSISEISRELNMAISTVSYHIDKMLRVGLVEVSGKKYGKRLQEVKLYRASNRPILLLPSPIESEKKRHLFNRFKVITLTLAVGISSLVYEIARRFSSANAHRPSETVRAFSIETTKRTASTNGELLPIFLAVMTFVIVIALSRTLRKRF
ncbi:ArsR/SmtB family transcription factor [Thermococcus sp.]